MAHELDTTASQVETDSATSLPKYPKTNLSIFKGNYLQFSRNTYLDMVISKLFENGVITQEYIRTYPKGATLDKKMQNIKKDIKKAVLIDNEKIIVELSLT